MYNNKVKFIANKWPIKTHTTINCPNTPKKSTIVPPPTPTY